jgi:gluconate 5-dehydrogenase
MTNYDLKEKTAIVTGASAGLGEQFAYALARSGANVAIGARRLDKLQDIARKIESDCEVQVLPIRTDVMKEDDIVRLIRTTSNEIGPVDIMVNNVGNYLAKPLIEQTLDDWNYVLNLNLTSAFIGCREAAKVMIPRKTGSIINLASTYSFGVTRFPVVSYYAAKSGIIGLTKALAVELGPHDIRVNAIAPGFFPTDQSKDAFTDKEIREKLIEPRTALPYLSEVEWIRGALCFLASDDAKYITGHTLAVDGGWLAF